VNLLQTDSPLYLPAGSVRSLLAIGVVGAYVAGLVDENIAVLVLAFYFADRSSSTA
jgi:hypothetical protein